MCQIQTHSHRFSAVLAVISILCCGAYAAIEEFSFADTRGMAMGGANAASVDDAAAGLINPAVLGFMARETEGNIDNNGLGEQNFGWNIIDAGLGATLTGDLGDYLEALGKIDFDNFETDMLKEPGNVESLLSFAGTLGNIGDGDTISATASLGTSVQIGHFGIGVRTFGQAGGWISDLDLVQVGLGIAVSEIADNLRDALDSEGFDPGSYTPQSLSGDQQQQLRDAFGGVTAEDVIKYVDSKVTELIADGTINPDQIKGAIDTISSVIENSGLGANLLADNQTSVTGRAFAALEIPVSYGYALNDNLSFGVTAKAIFGRVFGTRVWIFNDDNVDVITDSLDSSNDTAALGLDAAMMYRIPKAQFALVGHNLNRPTFEGYDQTVNLNGTDTVITIPDVELDPQVTLAAAWFPTKRITLEADLDLLETGTLLNYYDVQRLSFGTELDLSLVDLRLGTYNNIAESDLGWVLTAGVGVQLWAVSVDLGGAISIDDTVNYDGTDYPRTARLHAAIGMDF